MCVIRVPCKMNVFFFISHFRINQVCVLIGYNNDTSQNKQNFLYIFLVKLSENDV